MDELTAYEARQWRAATEASVRATRARIRRIAFGGAAVPESLRQTLQYHLGLRAKARRAERAALEEASP